MLHKITQSFIEKMSFTNVMLISILFLKIFSLLNHAKNAKVIENVMGSFLFFGNSCKRYMFVLKYFVKRVINLYCLIPVFIEYASVGYAVLGNSGVCF